MQTPRPLLPALAARRFQRFEEGEFIDGEENRAAPRMERAGRSGRMEQPHQSSGRHGGDVFIEYTGYAYHGQSGERSAVSAVAAAPLGHSVPRALECRRDIS